MSKNTPAGFSDHFAAQAAHYAQFRPHYPAQLFDWLAQQVPGHALAWDCATGSGQAAVGLAAHFKQVWACDASQAQLAHAVARPNIEYRQAIAQESGLPDGSVDLVSVAQAAHWLDLPAFYQEVRRVVKPGGLIAMWSYGVLEVEGAIANEQVQRFYYEAISPYWPPERCHVENGYRDLPFPFERVIAPPLAMTVRWRLPELMGYLRSWSATARYVAAVGRDPVIELESSLAAVWGDEKKEIAWPLTILAGRC